MASQSVNLPTQALGSGVSSVNTLTGSLTIASSGGATVSNGGSTITIGTVAPTSIGNLDAQSRNAKGLALVSNVLSIQSADATHPGLMTTGTQTIAGDKTFTGALSVNGIFDSNVFSVQSQGTATNVANQNSWAFNQYASYWDGAAAQSDAWTMQVVLGAGANPYSILNIAHSGTPGAAVVYLPVLDNTPIGVYAQSTGRFTTAQALSFQSLATEAILTGSAGTASCAQPFLGPQFQKAVCFLSGYTDTGTQTYTFPSTYEAAPYVYGHAALVAAATVTTSSIKFNGTLLNGYIFIEGS